MLSLQRLKAWWKAHYYPNALPEMAQMLTGLITMFGILYGAVSMLGDLRTYNGVWFALVFSSLLVFIGCREVWRAMISPLFPLLPARRLGKAAPELFTLLRR